MKLTIVRRSCAARLESRNQRGDFLVRGRAGKRLQQARSHFASARVEIDPTPEPALERLLGEQQRRRAFLDQRFRRRRRPGEDATGLGERVGESVNASAGQTGHRGPQCRNRLCENGNIGRFSLDQLLPRRLGARHRRARRRHRARIEATESRHLEVGRHRCIETEGATHLGNQRRARAARRIGARESEQRVLHQPFGDRSAIGDRAPQLQVHARQQALSVDVELDHAIAQGLEVGQRHFPEGRVPGPHLRGFDRVDRCVQRGDRCCIVRVAQHLQQAALELRARGAQFGRVELVHRRVGDHQPRRHRNHEQVGRMHALGAARFQQLAIVGKQVQRLVRFTEQQFVEILDHRSEAARDPVDQLARQAQLPALGQVEQRLGLRAERRDTGHIDERERAMRLVQRHARIAQRGQVAALVSGAGLGAAGAGAAGFGL